MILFVLCEIADGVVVLMVVVVLVRWLRTCATFIHNFNCFITPVLFSKQTLLSMMAGPVH